MRDHIMTEPMTLFRSDFHMLRTKGDRLEIEHADANNCKAEAEYAHALQIATVRQGLLDQGVGYNIANARATDSAVEHLHEVGLAKAASANASRAITLISQELDTLSALIHYANRELRVLDSPFEGEKT